MTESKRKGVHEDDGDSRANKRARTAAVDENPELATEKGLKFLENLRAARDKTGRPISTVFETLPDPKEHPDYYEEIKLPIALDTIEKKLKSRAYPSLMAVESDFKRLVQNAKHYNEKTSAIYQDAERVRKTASNWMVKNNPAYRDPNYTAQPTPVPGEELNGTSNTPARNNTPRTRRAVPSAQKQTPAKPKTPEPEPEPEAEDGNPFEGKTFQEAQEAIMDELINYVDEESGLQIFKPFEWLPPRSLTDYYQIIKYPVSLKGVQKKVKGQQPKGPSTGVSEFQTWEAFEREMNYIWENAWEYNEDGSDISNTAGELKSEFERLVTLAKDAVPEPSKTTLKLNMSQSKPSGLKLRFGPKASPAPSTDPNTPAGRSSATPGVIVDKEALERQQAHVQAGVNGGRPASSGTPSQRSGSISAYKQPSATPLPGGRPMQSPMANGFKNEAVPSPGFHPQMNGATPHHPNSMAPPHLQNRPPSGSPHPTPYGHPPSQHQMPQYIPPPTMQHQFPITRLPNVPPILPNITLATHPSLTIAQPNHPSLSPISIDIPPSATSTANSVVISLPASHHTLQLIPTIPVARTERPWRLFVMVNGMKVAQNMRPQGQQVEKDRPVFDIRLPIPVPGGNGPVNRIDVEILAAVVKPAADKEAESGDGGAVGVGATPTGKEKGEEVVVKESCSVFVHLMRA